MRNRGKLQRFLASFLVGALLLTMPGAKAYAAIGAVRVSIPSSGANSAAIAGAVNTSLSLPSQSLISIPSGIGETSLISPMAFRAAPSASVNGAESVQQSAEILNSIPARTEKTVPALSAEKGISAKEQQARFSQIFETRKDADQDVSKSDLDGLYLGGINAEKKDSVITETSGLKPRSSKLGRLIKGITVTAAAAVIPAPAMAAQTAPAVADTSSWLNSLPLTPVQLLLTASVLPFTLYLIPTLIRSFTNRRSRNLTKLAKSIVNNPDKTSKEGKTQLFVREISQEREDGSFYTDRAIVKVPEGTTFASKYYARRGGIVLESENVTPNKDGSFTVDINRYKMNARGKPVMGEHQVFVTWPETEKRPAELKTHTMAWKGSPMSRALIARWAPHESGKLTAWAIGLAAALPAFFMTSAAVSPITLFIWTGVGLLGGWISQNLQTTSELEQAQETNKWFYAGMAAILSTYFLVGIPAGLSLMFGYLSALGLARLFVNAKLDAPAPAIGKSKARRGSSFSKFKFALIALAMMAVAGGSLNPFPVSAGERTQMISQMEVGETGREYAAYLRSHPEVPIYIVQNWHNGAMESSLGLHTDAVPLIGPAKIKLSGPSYGFGTNYKDAAQLSLSTLLHEADHDKQEVDNGGIPTSLEHEYSAWDHQARFILEQLDANPELFAPGQYNRRKYLVLQKANNWLTKGPQGYRDYVKGIYDKNKPISQFTGKEAKAWRAYYTKHQAEMEEVWNTKKNDRELKARLSKAMNRLYKAGIAKDADPEALPSSDAVFGLLLAGLLSLMTLFGLERMASRIRSRQAQKTS
jgi:hypothetical protein